MTILKYPTAFNRSFASTSCSPTTEPTAILHELVLNASSAVVQLQEDSPQRTAATVGLGYTGRGSRRFPVRGVDEKRRAPS